MKYISLAAVAASLFLPLLAAPALAQGQCASAHFPNNAQEGQSIPPITPFFANKIHGIDTVTIYATEAAKAAAQITEERVREGAEKWTALCYRPDSTTSHFPNLVVDWAGTRPTITSQRDPAYNSTLLIDFVDSKPVYDANGNLELAKWTSELGVLTFHKKCPGGVDIPCGVLNGNIKWDTEWGASMIAHEIGHALGLDHEPSTCQLDTVMRPVTEQGATWTNINPHASQCLMVEKILNAEDPCHEAHADESGVHPCETDYYAQEPTPPQARLPSINLDTYATLDVCDGIFGWSCTSSFQPSCHTEIITATDNFGDTLMWTEWRCNYGFNGLRTDDRLDSSTVGGVTGVGPLTRLDSPAEDAAVSGDAVISGWAFDYGGVASYEFFLDGVPVQLDNFRRNLRKPSACQSAMIGYKYLCNDRVGFEGTLNTRAIPRGWHTLNVKVTDGSGWSALINREIFVEGCDAIAPTAQITSHGNGSTVSGIATFSVAAQDDDKISRTQLFVNGSKVASDWTAPYTLNWDSRTVADGVHRIQPRAVDACLNVGAGPSIDVVVDNVPDCETTPPTVQLAAPLAGSAVNGRTNLTAQASDNVAVDRVDFYVDGVFKGSDSAAPYVYSWQTQSESEGGHQIQVRAWDTCGNASWSTPVTLVVDNQPVCNDGSAVHLCFEDGRFSVEAEVDGRSARAIDWSQYGGFFTLDEVEGVELAFKYLDGRGVNGKYWFFHGSLTTHPYTVTVADAVTGQRLVFDHRGNSFCGEGDTTTFGDGNNWLFGDLATTGSCSPTSTSACLMGNRFRVEVKKGNQYQRGYAVDDRLSSFGFGIPAAPEVVVKMYDGRWVNGHFWLFYSSLTTEFFWLKVTDTTNGTVRYYSAPDAMCGQADGTSFQ